MTTRILPPEEWATLADTEAGAFAHLLPPGSASILVVEDDGRIVATWALITMMHAEGLWIAPAYRGRFGVVKRLLVGMRRLAQSLGCTSVQTGAITPDVEDLIHRLGGQPLPGRAFVLPMQGDVCQQR
jgi:hypothetical protein